MRINIRSRKVKVDAKTKAYIEEKMISLGKVLKRFEAKIDVPVAVEIFPATSHHRQGNIVAITSTVNLPGKIIVAHHDAADVVSGIDVVKDILQREIVKFKDRQIDSRRK